MRAPPSGKPLHVMLDIETLDTKPTSAILSIAAVPFACSDQFPYWTWYKKCDIITQQAPHFSKSADTIAWWEKQNKQVLTEAYAGAEKLLDVLHNLRTTLQDAKEAVGATRLEVWGFGANFDITILEHAFDVCRVPVPWSYKYIRCFRTLVALAGDVPRQEFSGAKHSALEDALDQARYAERILQHLYLKGVQYG